LKPLASQLVDIFSILEYGVFLKIDVVRVWIDTLVLVQQIDQPLFLHLKREIMDPRILSAQIVEKPYLLLVIGQNEELHFQNEL
jgi:hypothetical protein